MHGSLSNVQKIICRGSSIQQKLNQCNQNVKRLLPSGGFLEPDHITPGQAIIRCFASTSGGNGRIPNQARYLTGTSKIVEIGRLENPKSGEKYQSGQVFVHKIFGFRAVVLFPWTVTVYDTILPDSTKTETWSFSNSTDAAVDGTDGIAHSVTTSPVASFSQTYYQVLVDRRDLNVLKDSYCEDSGTKKDDGFPPSMPALKGFAYVSHDDILPYISSDSTPIEHEHLSRFLRASDGTSTALIEKPALQAWRMRFQDTLQLCEVHRYTAQHVRLTVMPFFVGSTQSAPNVKRKSYSWLCTLRVENLARDNLEIIDEEWTVFDSDMKKLTVQDKFITGAQPHLRLTPRSAAFQCQNRVVLSTRSGFIWGRLKVKRESGEPFDCRILATKLDSRVNAGLAVSVINDFPDR